MSNESMLVKEIDLRQFAPHPKNANKHGPEQIDELKKSHAKFGQPKPLVVWQGFILTGHANAQAFMQDEQFTVNAIDVSSWDEKKAVQWMNADNLTGRMGEYDADIFRGNLDWLGNDTDIPGLTNQVIEDLFGPDDVGAFDGLFGGGSDFEGDGAGDSEDREAPEPQIDRAEELAEELGVKVGQRWRLGKHIIICGDCTKQDVASRLMGNDIAEISFTSPPYSDARDYEGGDISVDYLKKFITRFAPFVKFQCVNLGLIFRGGEVIQYWDSYIKEAKDCGLKLLAWNIWDKKHGGSIASATNMFLLIHEFIFVFGKERKRLNRTIPNNMDAYKKRDGDDVLENGKISNIRQRDGSMGKSNSSSYTHHQLESVMHQLAKRSKGGNQYHPAVMRLEVPMPYIEAMTNEGDIVAEPFLGSGTTLIACEKLGRQCRAIELSPNYVAVTINRWQELTGLKATLEG